MSARPFMIALVTTVATFGGFVGTALAASAPVATFPSAAAPSSSVLFNGTSSIITVGHSAHLALSGAMTLEAWVRPSSTLSGRRDIIVKTRTRGGFPYGLELTNGVPDAYATIGAKTVKVSATSPLTPHAWSFIAAYYNGHSLQLYVNDRLLAARSAHGNLSTSTGPLQIGGDSESGRHYAGMIDYVRVYTHSFSTTQAKNHGRHPRPTTPTTTIHTTPTPPTPTKPTTTPTATTATTSKPPTTTLSPSTAQAPVLSASANLWVSLSGGSCARQSTKGAEVSSGDCGTLQAAWDAAQCGDTINIDSGNYGGDPAAPVTLFDTNAALRGTCSSPVVIEPGPGATRSSVIFGQVDSGYLGQDPVEGSSNWFIQDITIAAVMNVQGDSDNDTLNDIQGGTMYINGARNFTLENSNMGPCYNTLPGPNPAITCQSNFKVDPSDVSYGGQTTENITLNHDYFHDFIDNNTNSATDHDECIFLNGGVNETIENSKFSVCQLYAIFLQPYSGVPFTNLVIQNNWFSGTENGGSNADEYGTPRNTAVELGSNGPIGIDGALIRFNSFAADEGITQSSFGNSNDANDRIIANILGNGSCDTGVTYGYNLMINQPTCGTGDTTITTSPYINPTETPSGVNNYHLACGTDLGTFVTPNTADYQISEDLDGNALSSTGPRTPGSEQSTC